PFAPRPKLHGRAFYESIGSPKMIVAPMVDQSEFAWRLLTRSFIPDERQHEVLAYTPMFHSRLFHEKPHYRAHSFQPLKTAIPSPPDAGSTAQFTEQDVHLDGNPTLDRPLFVQFCSNTPDDFLKAAQHVAPFCDAVDLNLGCPQGIAKKGKYGAFLQEDRECIRSMIERLHKELSVPVTAKIRVQETYEDTLAYARMILEAGASVLTVHGRQRHQKGHETGLADWKAIRYLRENLPSDTVLFANGNILVREDIEECLRVTGADGVMSAEGNLHDPTIFATPPPVGMEGREYWRGRDGKGGFRMDAVFRRYMDIIHRHVLGQEPPERKPLFLPTDPGQDNGEEEENGTEDGQPPKKKQKREKAKVERATKKREKQKQEQDPNLTAMQPHLFRLLRPLVATHTHVRDALAKSRAGDMVAYENVLGLVEDVVKQGLLDYESENRGVEAAADPVGHQDSSVDQLDPLQLDPFESSVAAVRRCKRPWWVCQAYVRPLPKEAMEKGALTLSKKERAKLEKDG
ncbi:FMN-linked oxidoreductase, partial [Saccharata proteae CBS 121410]